MYCTECFQRIAESTRSWPPRGCTARHSPDLWEHHDARGKRLETKRFAHPEVGRMTLSMHAFDVKAVPGQELIVYHAEPGSVSAHALALLGALPATRAREQDVSRGQDLR
ncbi:MmyB family transcriptional regulator [Nocardia goodfellowii]